MWGVNYSRGGGDALCKNGDWMDKMPKTRLKPKFQWSSGQTKPGHWSDQRPSEAFPNRKPE